MADLPLPPPPAGARSHLHRRCRPPAPPRAPLPPLHLPTSPHCLLNCHLIPNHRLQPGSHPLLDSLHHLYNSTDGGEGISAPAALFLFPSTIGGSMEVGGAIAHDDEEEFSKYRWKCRVLIVFDGTWKHTREMVRASLPFLSCFTRQASLARGHDQAAEADSIFESELALRKEPLGLPQHHGGIGSGAGFAGAP